MKKLVVYGLLAILLLTCGSSITEAAANPIPSASANPTPVETSGAPPPAYLQSIKLLNENKYSENEIKSFVYQIFSLFDRHADLSQLLLLFSDDLDMKIPEGKILSHADFEKWYNGIGTNYQSNTYTVERLEVSTPAKGDYRVELVVLWQALGTNGKYTAVRTRQQWRVVDGGGYWPRIVRYHAEQIP